MRKLIGYMIGMVLLFCFAAWSSVFAGMQVAAGTYHTVGLQADGNVVAVGNNYSGQCDVSGWSGIVQVAVGTYHTVGLQADGTVVAVGHNYYGQCDVSGWSGIVQVAARMHYTVGLDADGTVVAVGNNYYGQCDVSDWSGIVQVSAGTYHTVGLQADGTVVAVGNNYSGQCNVSSWNLLVGIYSISGIVSGDVQADVTVTLSGLVSKITTTDPSGYYSFSELPNGTYTITPSLAGCTFEPPSREVIISNSDVTGVDFVSFATKPDLLETSVSNPPGTALVGNRFSATDTVENQGDADAGASTTRYYLSLDTTKSSDDKLLMGNRSVLALAVGATSSGSQMVRIPSGTAANNYYLLACSDDTRVVAESNETNNCISSSTTMQVKGPDLVETSVSNPPATVQVGSSFSVTDTVRNQGNANAGASTTQYYLSLDTRKSSDDKLLTGNRSVLALAVGATSIGSRMVRVPSETAANSYYLLACSDDTSVVGETNERNNCRASKTKVNIIP